MAAHDFDPSVDLTLATISHKLRDYAPQGDYEVTSARYVITARNAFCRLTMNGLTHDAPFGAAPIVGVQVQGRFRPPHNPRHPWSMEPGPSRTVAHLDLNRATGAVTGTGWADEAPDLGTLGDVHEVPPSTHGPDQEMDAG